jgi:hypothetical protein
VGNKKAAAAGFTDDDDALLAELGVETEVKKVQTYTPKRTFRRLRSTFAGNFRIALGVIIGASLLPEVA